MKINNQQTLQIICFFIIILFASCQKKDHLKESRINEEISSYVHHIIKRHQIPGVALAIIKNDSIILQENFGKANLEHNVAIKDSSIFRVYSLTKLPVAVAIFQLIEQQKITLKDNISKYVDDLPEDWKSISIENLITHSSGLPKMRSFPNLEKLVEKEVKDLVLKQDLQFKKGEKYDYNQTNFWLLQQIIEKITGENFTDFILENQFDTKKKTVFFSSNSRAIIANRVTAYFPFRNGAREIDHPTLVGDYMFAANGLNITLDEFINWDKRLRKNQLLKPKTRAKMWETFGYSKSNKVFTNGWDKRIINNHNSYGFSGSLVTAYRFFPEDNLSIIFLGNGMGNYFNIENIVNHIASLVDNDIVDINNQVFETLIQPIVDKDIHQFKSTYNLIKNSKYHVKINLEQLLNYIGYQLINQSRIEKAIDVFTFNTKENPRSANAFDSLAEAFFRNNNDSLAIKNYQKAVDLGGTKGNAKAMLKRLTQ